MVSATKCQYICQQTESFKFKILFVFNCSVNFYKLYSQIQRLLTILTGFNQNYNLKKRLGLSDEIRS